MAEPSTRRAARWTAAYPLDLAVLLVSIPVWTRENVFCEYPDRLPAPFANVMLTLRWADRQTEACATCQATLKAAA